jgi:CPA2 family monovalent cation:H+ antiporter-2
LFLIGLELSLHRLLTMRRLVFRPWRPASAHHHRIARRRRVAAGQKPSQAIILGASLSLSSTAIVLELLVAPGTSDHQCRAPAFPCCWRKTSPSFRS